LTVKLILLTPYQSQYYAWQLTRQAASDTVESLASTLVDSQVDLNPHQVEAALFACSNPLSHGVILADEVGLGKTIEAGLVISQRWAERRLAKAKADDLKLGLEQQIKEIDREIKDVRRTAVTSPTLEEKLSRQKQQRELEAKLSKLRRELFNRQDEVEAQRDDLIGQLEVQLQQQVEEQSLFTIEWQLR